MNKQIAVLLTCHNRRESTIGCLHSLYRCILPNNCVFDVFLVDDGSTDGTADAVKSNYPQVHIIQGNGNLFWNKGMHLAWESAVKTSTYNYYLWLNDDVVLFENAMVNLFESAPDTDSIVVGTMRSLDKQEITYGGWDGKGNLIVPNGKPQLCNEFNGNLVLIPHKVYLSVGNLDPAFPHAIGDFDYALRAKREGFKSFSTTKFSGICEEHKSLPKWCLPEVPLGKRFKVLYSPLGNSHPIYFFRFDHRHFGIFVAVKHFLSINLRATFPKLWK